MAIFRSKLLHKPPPPTTEHIAKERKQMILSLQEDLKQAEVRLNQRKKKTNDSTKKQHFPVVDCSDENELEQLSPAVDFLVDLCDTVSPVQVEDIRFMSSLHQAVDFIHAALKNLLSSRTNVEPLEGIVNSLVMHLLRRMCAAVQGDE